MMMSSAMRRHPSHSRWRRSAPVMVVMMAIQLFFIVLLSLIHHSAALPLSSSLIAFPQSYQLTEQSPAVISLPYDDTLIDPFPVTFPSMPPPMSLASMSLPIQYIDTSPVDPVAVVVDTVPDPTVLTLYDCSSGGARGARITAASLPYFLSTFTVIAVPAALPYNISHSLTGFAYHSENGLYRSASANVSVSISSAYQPPRYVSDKASIRLSTTSERVATIPLLSLTVIDTADYDRDHRLTLTVTNMPVNGTLYAISTGVLESWSTTVPAMFATSTIPSNWQNSAQSPTSLSGLLAQARMLNAGNANATGRYSVLCSVSVCSETLLYVSSAGYHSDGLAFIIDDGLSSLPNVPMTVTLRTLVYDNALSITSWSWASALITEAATVPLACQQTRAPASQCFFTVVTLPLYGRLYAGDVAVLLAPSVVDGTTFYYRPYDPTANVTVTDQFTYQANNGIVDSSLRGVVSLTLLPAEFAAVSKSFAVSSVNDDEIAIQFLIDTVYANRSFAVTVLSLPDSALGTLLALSDSSAGTRVPITSVPFTLTPAKRPSVIFSPTNSNTDRHNGTLTSFQYVVVDNLQRSPSVGTVNISVGPRQPVRTANSVSAVINQFDPISLSLTATGGDSDSGRYDSVVTSLPVYGTLYQFASLPNYVYNQSSVLTARFNNNNVRSGNLLNLQCLNSPTANTDSGSVPSHCIPPSIIQSLTPITVNATVTDALHRVIYVPNVRNYNTDIFTFTVTDSGSGGGSTGNVSVTIQPLNTPPVLLPPSFQSYNPLTSYLGTSGNPWQLWMYSGDEMLIPLASYDATPTGMIEYAVTQLPASSTATVFYYNTDGWVLIPPLTVDTATNTTVPYILPADKTQLGYTPSQRGGRAAYQYLYDSIGIRVSDGSLSSHTQTVLISLVPKPARPVCHAASFAVNIGQSLLVPLLTLVDSDNLLDSAIVIDSLPSLGLLLQTNSDGSVSDRHSAILSPSTPVTDRLLKIIYRPYHTVADAWLNDTALSYLSPAFMGSDIQPSMGAVNGSYVDQFVYRVVNITNGLQSSFCSISVTVLPAVSVIQAPSFIVTTAEHSSVAINFPCVDSVNDTSCQYTLTTLPNRGSLLLCSANNGSVPIVAVPYTVTTAVNGTVWSICYQPDGFAHGDPITYNFYSAFTYSFQSHSYSQSLPGTVTLAVTQMNIAPVLSDKNVTVEEDGWVVFNLSAADNDPSISYTVWIASLPQRGALYQFDARNPNLPKGKLITVVPSAVMETEANGEPGTGNRVVFVPEPLTSGANYSRFWYYANDAYESSIDSPSLVIITVLNRHHAPTVTPLSFTIDSSLYVSDDSTLTSSLPGRNQVLLDFSDCCDSVDGTPLFIAINLLPRKGVLYRCPIDQPQCYQYSEQRLVIDSPMVPNLNTSQYSFTVNTSYSEVSQHFVSLVNTTAYLNLDNWGGFYPYLNFTYVALDVNGQSTPALVMVLLKCGPGSVPNIWSDFGDVCVTCPSGAQCSTDGTFKPYALYGYFKMTVTQGGLSFAACHPASACEGGYEGGCASGYSGVLCGSCQSGYYHLESTCVTCPSAMLIVTALVMACLVGASFIVLATLSRHRISFACVFILMALFQTLSIFNNYNLRWPAQITTLFTVLSAAALNLELFAPSCYWPTLSYSQLWAAKILLLPVLSLTLVLVYGLVTAYQFVRYDSRQYSETKFSNTQLLLRYQTILLCLTFLPLLSKCFQLFNCSVLPDQSVIFNPDSSLFCTEQWHSVLAPFAVITIVILTLFVLIWVGGGISKHVPHSIQWRETHWGFKWFVLKDKQKETKSKSNTKGNSNPRTTTTSITTWSLPSPSSQHSAAILSPQSRAASNNHHNHRPRHRDLSLLSALHTSFAFLTAPFKPQYFYWYLIIMVRLLLLSVSCMLYPDVPIVAATFSLCVLILSWIIQAMLSPYASQSLNRLEQCSLLVSAFVLFCGVIFKGDESSQFSPMTSPLSESFIVFIFVAFFACLAFFSFIFYRKIEKLLFCRRCRRVPPLRIKSGELINKVGKRMRHCVSERRDLIRVRSKEEKARVPPAFIHTQDHYGPPTNQQTQRQQEREKLLPLTMTPAQANHTIHNTMSDTRTRHTQSHRPPPHMAARALPADTVRIYHTASSPLIISPPALDFSQSRASSISDKDGDEDRTFTVFNYQPMAVPLTMAQVPSLPPAPLSPSLSSSSSSSESSVSSLPSMIPLQPR